MAADFCILPPMYTLLVIAFGLVLGFSPALAQRAQVIPQSGLPGQVMAVAPQTIDPLWGIRFARTSAPDTRQISMEDAIATLAAFDVSGTLGYMPANGALMATRGGTTAGATIGATAAAASFSALNSTILPAHSVLRGTGTSQIAVAAPGTSRRCLRGHGSGADPSAVACRDFVNTRQSWGTAGRGDNPDTDAFGIDTTHDGTAWRYGSQRTFRAILNETNARLALNGTGRDLTFAKEASSNVLAGDGISSPPSLADLPFGAVTSQAASALPATPAAGAAIAAPVPSCSRADHALTPMSNSGPGCSSGSGARYSATNYGVNCNGVTDNAAVLNNLISTVFINGGGVIILPEGTCMLGSTLILKTGVIIQGQGRYATILKARAGLSGATDLIQTYQFSALAGTSANAGPYMWGLYDLSIDGNKSHRTGTGGRDLAIFGYDYRLTNLYIQMCPGDCVYSSWGDESGGAEPVPNGGVTIADYWDHVYVWGANNNGITYSGPSDSHFNDIETFLNVNYGLLFRDNTTTGATVTDSELTNVHSYGNGNWGVAIDGEVDMMNVQSESNFGQCGSVCPGYSPSGGGGIVILPTSGHGQIRGAKLYAWNNKGDGMDIDNPGYGTASGNNIAGLQLYSNQGAGLSLSIGTDGPSTILSAVTVDGNTGAGIIDNPGSAFVSIDGLDDSRNGGNGVTMDGSYVSITGAQIYDNTGTGFDMSGDIAGASDITLQGHVLRNGGISGYQINFGSVAAVATDTFLVNAQNTNSEHGWTGTPGPALVSITGDSATTQIFSTPQGALVNGGIVGRIPQTIVGTFGAATLSAAGMVNGSITRTGIQTAPFTDTTDTAANLIAAVPGYQIDATFTMRIHNGTSGGHVETIAGGSGVAISGTASINDGTWRDFLCRITSSTTVACTNNGGGNN